jgi:hypothetical protein
MVNYSTWMGSYITTDGELQHTGWVKINGETDAGRCKNIFGQNKKLLAASGDIALHFRKFLFFKETSL